MRDEEEEMFQGCGRQQMRVPARGLGMGLEWQTICYNCKELHQAVKCKAFGENKKGQDALVFERNIRQRNRFPRSGQCRKIQIRPPGSSALRNSA